MSISPAPVRLSIKGDSTTVTWTMDGPSPYIAKIMGIYIVYKSRAQRDRINAKLMKDPRLADMMDPKNTPFDGKRLIYGGLKLKVGL